MSAVGETAAVAHGPGSGKGAAAAALLAAVFVIGAATLVFALASEGVEPDYPLLTASFLYLIGVSQAGVLFSAIMRIVGAHWSKPYYRIGELATLAFFPFAILMFLLLYFYAQDELFYWLTPSADAHLSPWLNIDWLLIRNLAGLLLFYGLSAVYVLKALRPDLTSGASSDHDAVEGDLRAMAPFVIVAFMVCNTLLAWDFGMMLIEHWYSTVFPIYFSFGNLYAGSAALLLIPAVMRHSSEARLLFGRERLRSLAIVITGFTLIWLYLFWAQFFVIWFGNLPRETEPLWRQMYGHYAPYYWAMMSLCFFVPFAAFIFAAVKRSLVAMCVLAAAINVGIWLNKYLTVVPVFSSDHTPFVRWLDIGPALGLLAGFLAVLVYLVNRLPAFSYWEIARTPESHRA